MILLYGDLRTKDNIPGAMNKAVVAPKIIPVLNREVNVFSATCKTRIEISMEIRMSGKMNNFLEGIQTRFNLNRVA